MADRQGQTGRGDFVVQLKYEPPHQGLWNGELVTIAALGNQEGFSPANLIQGNGNQYIAPIGEVRDLTLRPFANLNEMETYLGRALAKK